MELLKHKGKHNEYTYYLKPFGVNKEEEVLHGLYRHWYLNGQLNYEHNYKDGERHGSCRGWYTDGRLEYECYCWEGEEYMSNEAYEEKRITNKNW